MTTEEKRAQGKRNKSKGARNERRSRDYLYKIGAERVVKAGGSLGEFDLVAFFPGEVIAVQVKTNAWPNPAERAAMQSCLRMHYIRKEMHRWNTGAREPEIRALDTFNL